MRTLKVIFLAAVIAVALLSCSCTQQEGQMYDGYYTAEGIDFGEYGWKEYITIYVSNNKILTVEYDAYNASGFTRSWDINYMRNMDTHSNTYPNEFTRAYAVALLNWQNPDEVDAISGATSSHTFFQILAKAAIEQAKTGNKQVVLVELAEPAADTATEG